MMGQQLTTALAVHVFIAAAIGFLALEWKGRSFIMWSIIGFFISFVGLLILLFMPSMKKPTEEKASPQSLRSGPGSTPLTVAPHEHEKLWSAAFEEWQGAERKTGIWAQALAEANGDESIAKAKYLKARHQQLLQAKHLELEANLLASLTEEERRDKLAPKGACPSCAAVIHLAADKCAKCGALFGGAEGAWKPVPVPQT